jgi:hypothetical protein
MSARKRHSVRPSRWLLVAIAFASVITGVWLAAGYRRLALTTAVVIVTLIGWLLADMSAKTWRRHADNAMRRRGC